MYVTCISKKVPSHHNEEEKVDAYNIQFEIEDDGIGINKNDIPYLTQLFGPQKVNKEKKNIGLGLSISSMLSEKLGQKLIIQSKDFKPNTGTVIKFQVYDHTYKKIEKKTLMD